MDLSRLSIVVVVLEIYTKHDYESLPQNFTYLEGCVRWTVFTDRKRDFFMVITFRTGEYHSQKLLVIFLFDFSVFDLCSMNFTCQKTFYYLLINDSVLFSIKHRYNKENISSKPILRLSAVHPQILYTFTTEWLGMHREFPVLLCFRT